MKYEQVEQMIEDIEMQIQEVERKMVQANFWNKKDAWNKLSKKLESLIDKKWELKELL